MIDLKPITTLLFDIDNTLVLLDEKIYIGAYTKTVFKRFKDDFTSYKLFFDHFLESTVKMFEEIPSMDNQTKFMKNFKTKTNLTEEVIIHRFEQFYTNEYDSIKSIAVPNPTAKQILDLTSKDFTLVAATNPMYPMVANEVRLSWENIHSKSIPWLEISSAENYHYTKPNLKYFKELLGNIHKDPSECLMIGNDPYHDMVANELGIQTYLVKFEDIELSKIVGVFPEDDTLDLEPNGEGSLTDLMTIFEEHLS